MEKKVYETPEVTKVEIDFSDRIIAAACAMLLGSSVECEMDAWGS